MTSKRTSYLKGKLRALADTAEGHVSFQSALDCYFDSILQPDTKTTYRNAFFKMFKMDFFSKINSLNDFKKINLLAAFEIIREDHLMKPGQKRTARIALASFVSYLNAELNMDLDIGAQLIDADRKVESEQDPLRIEEWEAFIKSLRELNPRDALIAEILQLANSPIFVPLPQPILNENEQLMKENLQQTIEKRGPGDKVLEPAKIRKDKPAKGTPIVTLKMVLEMQKQDVCFETQCLLFGRIHRGCLVLQNYPFPPPIFEALGELLKNDNDLVFSTAAGSQVRESQLKRSFWNASKRAQLNNITPARVRVPIPKLVYCPLCQKSRWNNECVCMWH